MMVRRSDRIKKARGDESKNGGKTKKKILAGSLKRVLFFAFFT